VTTKTDNADLARRGLREIWDERLDATAHEMMAPTAVGHLEGLTTRGAQEFLDARAFILNAFPDFKLVIEDLLAQGENVVFRWAASGTHRGELLGVAPTQKRVNFSGITWQRWSNGKLVEGWDCWNQGRVMAELEAHAATAAADAAAAPPAA
jgi:predicted ester cyclase